MRILMTKFIKKSELKNDWYIIDGKNAVVGRNFAYKPIVLKEQFDVGDEVSVEIVEVTSHTLVGKISH